MKGRNKARAHPVPKSTGLKQLVRGVARSSHKTVARQAMLNKKIRRYALLVLKKDVQKEIKLICSKTENSILRDLFRYCELFLMASSFQRS